MKRGGSLSFLVGTISNVLVMEIGWTDVGSGGYILVSCAHSNTSCICKHGDAVYSSWQLCTYRHGRKEVFVNLLVRKIIYDYMYPVDLENNEKSCEYSAMQYVAKSIATCKKKNPYIINQNHIFSKNYCEVIFG